MSERLFEELGELERQRQAEVPPEPAELSSAFRAKLAQQSLAALREHSAPAKVLRPARWIPALAVVLAVAAGALLFWVPSSRLPAYELTINGGERSHRSGQPGPSNSVLKISEGTVLSVELRPEEPVAGLVAARAYLYAAEKLRAWDSSFEISPEGSVRGELSAGTSELEVLSHRGELVLVLAAGSLPEVSELEETLRTGLDTPGLQIFRRALERGPETR
jgi:hypothetical protein